MRKLRALKKAAKCTSAVPIVLSESGTNNPTVKPGTLRMQKHRLKKKAKQTTFQAKKEQAMHALRMRVLRRKQLANNDTSKDAVRSKVYRENMSPECKAIQLEKARANASKCRRIRKRRLEYAEHSNEGTVYRAKNAARTRLYRLRLPLHIRWERNASAVPRSRLHRLKFRRDAPGERERFIWKYRQYKNKKRYVTYNRTRIDTTALVRSRLRRHCNHPPCRESREIEGMWHYARYCHFKHPGARETYMEECRRAGLSDALYNSDDDLVYADGWSRSKIRWIDKSFKRSFYIVNGDQHVFVELDDRGMNQVYDVDAGDIQTEEVFNNYL